MKTKPTLPHSKRRTKLAAIATCLLLAPWALSSGLAAGNSGNDNSYQNNPNVSEVRVARASQFIGTDVMSADGRKVGDIVDFVFDPNSPSRLDYIVVMTGGFLDIGGTTRAIPADALQFNGDTARIRLDRQQYDNLPKISGDRKQWLSNPQNVSALDQAFQVKTPAPSGQQALVSYSQLQRRDAFSQSDDSRLGYIDDVWISLSHDRAPFVEIVPTLNPFQVAGRTRYAIPMSRLVPSGMTSRGATFAVSYNELNHANSVNETPGVQMVNDGFVRNQILRVAVNDATNQSAGGPTGYSSNDQNPASASPQAVTAARAIRNAIDRDGALASAKIHVIPQNDRVLLQGYVANDALKQRAESCAEGAANGYQVQNELNVQNQ